MEIIRLVTETEKNIVAKRVAQSWTADKVFSKDTVQSSFEVLKTCGGNAVVLYRALLGSYASSKDTAFKLPPVFREASCLSKSDLSRATSALEAAGYIEVKRKAGHKNIFTLTAKGKRGMPPAYDSSEIIKKEVNKNE